MILMLLVWIAAIDAGTLSDWYRSGQSDDEKFPPACQQDYGAGYEERVFTEPYRFLQFSADWHLAEKWYVWFYYVLTFFD